MATLVAAAGIPAVAEDPSTAPGIGQGSSDIAPALPPAEDVAMVPDASPAEPAKASSSRGPSIELSGILSAFDRLTQTTGLGVRYSRPLTNSWAAFASGAFAVGTTTTLVDNIRVTAKLSGTSDDLSGAGALGPFALSGFRWHGLAFERSDGRPAADLGVGLAIGFALVTHHGVLSCAVDSPYGSCPGDFRTERSLVPVVAPSVDSRWFVGERLWLSAGWQGVVFPDRYWEKVDLKKAASTGQVAADTGFSMTSLVVVSLGVSL
ncbi:MAG: hypothetical protein RL199_1951 [Pseudomonadota bacterium]|jgi:hypothetical protein